LFSRVRPLDLITGSFVKQATGRPSRREEKRREEKRREEKRREEKRREEKRREEKRREEQTRTRNKQKNKKKQQIQTILNDIIFFHNYFQKTQLAIYLKVIYKTNK